MTLRETFYFIITLLLSLNINQCQSIIEKANNKIIKK